MYFWKTKDLASEIKIGNIDEIETKNYYIATSILVTGSMYLAIGEGSTNGIATLVECISLIIIAILGINFTFKTNQKNGGNNYIARVTILSLPILIKLFVFAMLIGVVLGVAVGASGQELPLVTQWPLVIVSVVVQLIYFWRINVHLQHINT